MSILDDITVKTVLKIFSGAMDTLKGKELSIGGVKGTVLGSGGFFVDNNMGNLDTLIDVIYLLDTTDDIIGVNKDGLVFDDLGDDIKNAVTPKA